MHDLQRNLAELADRYRFISKRNQELLAENEELRKQLEAKLNSSELIQEIGQLKQKLERTIADRENAHDLLRRVKANYSKQTRYSICVQKNHRKTEMETEILRYQLKNYLSSVSEEEQNRLLKRRLHFHQK